MSRKKVPQMEQVYLREAYIRMEFLRDCSEHGRSILWAFYGHFIGIGYLINRVPGIRVIIGFETRE